MDPDVVEISPPPSRFFKHKEVGLSSVIEIEDEAGDMFLDDLVDKKNKGKSKRFESDRYDDRLLFQEARVNHFGSSGEQSMGLADKAGSSNGFFTGSSNIINIDDNSSDESCDYDDDYIDLSVDDYVDEYAMLQAHFDKSDIPPGIEAPVPFLLDPHQSTDKRPVTRSSTRQALLSQTTHLMSNPSGSTSVPTQVAPTQTFPMHYGINSSSSSRFTGPAQLNSVSTSNRGSRLPVHMDDASQPSVVDVPLPWSLSQSQTKKKAANFQHRGTSSANSSLGVVSKSRWRRPFQNKKKQVNFGPATYYDSVDQSNGTKQAPGVAQPFWDSNGYNDQINKLHMKNFAASIGMGNQSGVAGHTLGAGPHPWVHPLFNANNFKASLMFSAQSSFDSWGSGYNAHDMGDVPWLGNSDLSLKSEPSADGVVQGVSNVDKAEVLSKLQTFKQFDTVEDHSDHQYRGNGSSTKLPSKSWAKRIQEEWKILEKDLPESIFVRVYESRMDLMRAVIVGAEGTPYHDGLFFFDVFFPNNYPNVPPHVYYHSGGLRLNPNLYHNGKVCLSLLNTWSGSKNEKWLPGTSTMLQVFVSIQALILNAKPYFNEPGYANSAGTIQGEKKSLEYNESTFILSLKTMTYSIRKPPKYFEDLVMGHFLIHAHDVMIACKAYLDGAQVGCLVKGGVQDVDEGDKSCSKNFKDQLATFICVLVKEFSKIGVEDCEKYLPPVAKTSRESGSASQSALRTLKISG